LKTQPPSGSGLEEVPGYGIPLVYFPFLLEDRTNPEVLTAEQAPETRTGKGGAGSGATGAKNGVAGDAGAVILERDGVHYIDRRVMTPDRETVKKLDQDFLGLVNSVLK
jgi:hypothetical protein